MSAGVSLHRRFAIGFAVLLVALGALFYVAERHLSERYHLELTQRLNQSIAMYIDDSATLVEDGALNEPALAALASRAMIINPSAEIYFLDAEGRVRFPASPAAAPARVDLAPVQALLDPDARLPVTGDDPRGGRRRVFSAHPVSEGGRLVGYVYVILGGTAFEATADAVAAGYQQQLALAAIVLVLVAALLAGWALFRRLTRPLGRLTERVAAFRSAAGSDLPIDQAGDELETLEVAFDAMSERIAAQLAQLRDSDRLRRELVGNVSHDLRTPLASIRGYIDTLLIRDSRLTAEQRRNMLQVAARNAARMSALVQDLFELSRLEAGAVVVHAEPFCLAELANDVAQEFALRAQEANVTLGVAPPSAPITVLADIALIQRVLENLIDNALKHTPSGGRVDIVIEARGRGYAVAVADTGSGINAEHLPHIFERHYAVAGGAPGAASEATGLGLAIVRKILELHESRLTIDSERRRGTEVRFDLPAAA